MKQTECPKLFIENIKRVLDLATDDDVSYGAAWYNMAQDECKRIQSKTNVHYKTVAAVMARLSPNNRWERNIIDAERMVLAFTNGQTICDFKVGTYNNNKLKAWKILMYSRQNLDYSSILSSQKIKSFYNCIVGVEDVCVDRHALSIMYWLKRSNNVKITPKIYKQAQIAYTLASADTPYTPAQVQAITWSICRRILGSNRNRLSLGGIT